MNLGSAQVIRGDARHIPVADNSVDLVVTSPPYFALRSYQDGGAHYAGQIGSEPTPAEFVAALLEVTRECVRVLKPSGSLWVNLGDKYAQTEERSRNGNGNRVAIDGFTGGKPLRDGTGASCNRCGADAPRNPCPYSDVPCEERFTQQRTVTLGRKENGVPRKSLMGIPWRYALACIDDLGLILRAEVIWSKPNGLPESVTDRVRRSHEQWFHFTLSPRYFSAVDEVRERYEAPTATRSNPGRNPNRADGGGNPLNAVDSMNPLGKLPGSVWTIPTEPLRVPDHLGIDHFAAFPTEWPRRIIQGWSPSGICTVCGEGLTPVTGKAGGRPVARAHRRLPGYTDPAGEGVRDLSYRIEGYSCACSRPTDTVSARTTAPTTQTTTAPAVAVADGSPRHIRDATVPTRPAVILDPFGGTGTTALVAKALGRHGITLDMSADYCRLADWRTNDRDQLAKVLGIEKAPPVPEDQLSIFDIEGGDAA